MIKLRPLVIASIVQGFAMYNWSDPIWRKIHKTEYNEIVKLAEMVEPKEEWGQEACDLLAAYIVAKGLYTGLKENADAEKSEALPGGEAQGTPGGD